jgi:hypothetical protein
MARLLGGVLLVALVLGLAGPSSAKPVGLLGIEQNGARPVALWIYNPSTLRTQGGNVPLAGHGRAWSFSPDRSQIALASAWSATLARPTSVRFVEMTHTSMRVLGDLRLAGETASVRATAWLRPDRVLALLADGRSIRVLALDPRRLEVVGRKKVPAGFVLAGGSTTKNGFVLLLTKRDAIGPATLATVDSSLRLRTVRLKEITAGSKHVRIGNDVEGTFRSPGLAVDTAGSRAFVISAGQPVARVDLATWRLSYHPVATRLPQSRTKRSEGTEVNAEWLGNGLLAVAGWNQSLEGTELQPTGLRVIDTSTWTERLVDPTATSFLVAGSTLVAQIQAGLVGYDFAGADRFRLDGQTGWLQTVGSRLYVAARENRTARIVDAVTGAVLGSYRGSIPRLLGDSRGF